MSHSFYKNSIQNFLKQNDDEIFGIIVKNDVYDSGAEQKAAWKQQIQILKQALKDIKHGSILFEYTLPRVGGRIDNILLINNTVIVLEFKVGKDVFETADIRQVRTYAFDLAHYHEESHSCTIVPVLCATDVKGICEKKNNFEDDVVLTNENKLADIIIKKVEAADHQIDLEKWENSRYVPTPTIIQAAEILYTNNDVREIAQNTAAENLTKTSDAVQNIIKQSKEKQQKSICFITGVPGAGKTLAGLNIAIENQKANGKDYACFLTGNQPLVDVLREALAQDDKRQNGTKITDARNKVKSFIQIIHNFRDESLVNEVPPVDNVVIFDEAQRAWTNAQLAKFMKEKKQNVLNKLTEEQSKHFISMSEPELLIEYMNRHTDWAVIVCLVGGGQDINTGEAGIQEWFESLKRSFSDWNVYVSGNITGKEYLGDLSFEKLVEGLNCSIIDELHLSVSLRSHRTIDVAGFVDALIDNKIDIATEKYKKLSGLYPIYITRDLDVAKQWCRKQTDGKQLRHGLIASSNGLRLRAEGIWVKSKCEPERWFLDDRDSIKSSYFMEETASEFDIQGLEIDYAVVAWDANYRYVNNTFEYWCLRGNKWVRVNKEDERRYLKNAYRVLLTRAREGFVIFIPHGDNKDMTRQCKFYDELWKYLKKIGIEEL